MIDWIASIAFNIIIFQVLYKINTMKAHTKSSKIDRMRVKSDNFHVVIAVHFQFGACLRKLRVPSLL